MKRNPYRLLLNVCSLSLLALALYLNFVKKETAEEAANATAPPATPLLKDKPQPSSAKETAATAVLK